MTKPKTMGQMIAEYSVAMRKKYGCYPVPEGTEPLKGHENDQIEEPPNYPEMDAKEVWQMALNRADDRQRFLPILPRQLRLATRSRQRHIEMLEWRNGEDKS